MDQLEKCLDSRVESFGDNVFDRRYQEDKTRGRNYMGESRWCRGCWARVEKGLAAAKKSV